MSFHKHNSQIDILKGLQIDEPNVFVPWDKNVKDVEERFPKNLLIHITDGYYTIKDVTLFDILTCNIGLHYDHGNMLKRIEFFRNDYDDLIKSYKDFQIVFENKFGKPIKRKKVLNHFESCEWDIEGKVKIHHYVMDRFGLAEYLYIERK